MFKKILFTSLVFSLLTPSTFAAGGACAIENGPIPELVSYSRAVDTRLSTLTSQIRGTTACGPTQGGATARANQTLETIDRAFLQIPIFDNTFLDFQYNFKTILDGNVRAPVLRDGQMFASIEQRISNALGGVARTCTLDGAMRSEFQNLILQNTALENIFKQAVLGYPVAPSGLSDENLKVAEAINASYTPPMVAGCKTNSNIEDLLTTIQKRMERNGKRNESALENWRIAIKLLRGGGSDRNDIIKYTDTQRRLLQAELGRQGLTGNMSQIMMSNFNCFKEKTQGDNASESAVQARIDCLKNPIVGIERLMLPWRKKVEASRTLPERVQRVNTLTQEKDVKVSVESTYTTLMTQVTPQSDDNKAIITNLVDLHISLVATTDMVKKRLPIMQRNCMKARPDIVGGCKD